jgi:hypothetical protein
MRTVLACERTNGNNPIAANPRCQSRQRLVAPRTSLGLFACNPVIFPGEFTNAQARNWDASGRRQQDCASMRDRAR